MVKTKFFFLIVFMLSLQSFAQVNKIQGSWLLTKVEIADEIQEPYATFDFNTDNSLVTMGIKVGNWKLENNQIIMSSTLDKDFNGTNKISILTDTSMVLIKDKAKLFYSKIDKENLIISNKKSGLIGTWEFRDKDKTYFLEIKDSDTFTLLTLEEGITSTSKGEWMYNPEKKTIIFVGFAYDLRGESKIIKHTKSTLEFKHKNKIFKANLREENKKIERLSFNYEDFPEEIEDAVSLSPWTDFYNMIDNLSSISKIEYKRAVLQNEVNQFVYSTVYSTIETADESIIVKDFISKDKQTTQINTSNSKDFYGSLSFFPKEEPYPYRKVAEEVVETPAGTFQCVVIEGFQGEKKVKYWMIKDKPGIFAKIIEEELDVFDKLSYTTYILATLNKK